MPEWLIELVSEHPSYTYVAVGLVFVLCGVGLPLPEEIVLVSAGYLCYLGHSEYWVMTGVCTTAILVGDLVLFLAGRAFGPRLLRLRWMRFIINRERLAMFDRWFRRRGDLTYCSQMCNSQTLGGSSTSNLPRHRQRLPCCHKTYSY